MFSKTSEFKVTDQGQMSEVRESPKTELEQLQARWYSALEEGYQSKRLKVFRLKQDGAERLFYVLTENSAVEPLKTTIRARCMRDDLAIYDLQVTYTTTQVGTKQEAVFKLVPDPKTVGVDPLATMQKVDRIINARQDF